MSLVAKPLSIMAGNEDLNTFLSQHNAMLDQSAIRSQSGFPAVDSSRGNVPFMMPPFMFPYMQSGPSPQQAAAAVLSEAALAAVKSMQQSTVAGIANGLAGGLGGAFPGPAVFPQYMLGNGASFPGFVPQQQFAQGGYFVLPGSEQMMQTFLGSMQQQQQQQTQQQGAQAQQSPSQASAQAQPQPQQQALQAQQQQQVQQAQAIDMSHPRKSDSKPKVFKCDFPNCTLAYKKSSHLKNHKRRHTGEKPFMCAWPGCNWSFCRSDELSRHSRSHNGDRPFACDVCDKKFTRSDHLAKHVRIHQKPREDSPVPGGQVPIQPSMGGADGYGAGTMAFAMPVPRMIAPAGSMQQQQQQQQSPTRQLRK